MEELPSGLVIPSIEEQRGAIGLSTPLPEERQYVWETLSIPSANILEETGGFRPHRIVQRLHDGPWRYVAEGGGLRFGKSLGLACEATVWLPHSNLIWLASETYDLSRQEFEYLAEAATSLGWVDDITMPKNKYQPCAFETIWGTRVETRSLHDLGAAGQGNSLVARAPDFIAICEPGFAPMQALRQAQERLTTRRGRLWMAGTFENAQTWFTETWKRWTRWPNVEMGKSLATPTWLNLHSFPGGKQDPELLLQRRQSASFREFLMRWGGVPMASVALVMGEHWDERKHVSQTVEFQQLELDGMRKPVFITVDPGFSGTSNYSVLAIQELKPNYFGIIDEVSVQSLVHEDVINLCRQRPWWRNVAMGVIDPYAGVNHVYGSTSPQEVWWTYGKIPLHAAPRLEVEELVSRIQFSMRGPDGRSHVSVNPGCKRLIWEMTHWRRVTTREGLGKPSDSYCDSIKALGYFLSTRYTEGINRLGQEPIRVSELRFAGTGPQGVENVDRYPNSRHRRGE